MPPSAQETPVPPEENPSTGGTPQLPWSQIPKFIPGVTNVQEYAQKLRFLASLWPSEYLEQLAPRAALMVEGSAFKMISRISPAKLKVNDVSGVAAIVEAIGSSWGSTELEERYEYFEKALYGTVQKMDESHDSYLSRMESNFVELISRNTTLEEVRAYILLRQSTLSGEDKKRILLEHGGDLRYQPVVKSFRLLGSKFFNEFQTGRAQQKTKVYDANLADASEGPFHDPGPMSADGNSERAYHAQVDETDGDLDPEYVEALVSQEDQDALTVTNFETEFTDFCQDVPELHDALVTYLEARSKLIEKKKARGFWPVKGRGKNKGKFKHGGKRPRDRAQLLEKISRSHCRKCGLQGHWKAECPNAGPVAPSGPSQASTSATANVVIDERPHEVFHADAPPEDVISEDEDEHEKKPTTDSCPFSFTMGFIDVVEECLAVFHIPDSEQKIGKFSQRLKLFNQNTKRNGFAGKPMLNKSSSVKPRNATSRELFRNAQGSYRPFSHANRASPECANLAVGACPTHAILDTGASRCIIGEKTLEKLKHALPETLSRRFRKQPSAVRFRFGNNQSLTSMYAIQMPLRHVGPKQLWLSIEVVPGQTPFLFSQRAFRKLHGALDSEHDTCQLRKVRSDFIPLTFSPTGLYLIDMLDICVVDDVALLACTATHTMGNAASKLSKGVNLEVFSQHEQPQSDAVESLKFATHRVFRPKPLSVTSISTTSVRQNATNGFDAQDRGRIGDPAPDVASQDPRASARTSRSSGRSRSSSRPRGDLTTARDDARTSQAKIDVGNPDEPTGDNAPAGQQCRKSEFRKFSNPSAVVSKCTTRSSQASDFRRGRSSFRPSGPFKSHHSSRCRDLEHPDRRTGRFRGSDHRRKSTSSSFRRPFSCHASDAKSTKFASAGQFDRGRMGTTCDYLGPQTSRQDICPSDGVGPGLPFLEHGAIQQPSSGATRLCALWPTSSSLPQLRGSEQFQSEVESVRESLKSPCKLLSSQVQTSHVVEQAIEKLEDSLISSASKSQNTDLPVILLEIYANNHSPLTEAVQQLGFRAMRFTKQDGDLSTFAGRQKLWNVIERFSPEHIWVAPECGPWGGWNQLNQGKSLILFDKIVQSQLEQIPHAKLCARLGQYQIQHGRHFHFEQPNGSQLPKLNVFDTIRSKLGIARFDMCKFGLRIPKTNRFLRKRSQVLTTSRELFHSLHQQYCTDQHEHQRLEGNACIDGIQQRLTAFCATYSSGFAMMIARQLCKRYHTAIGPDELALAASDDEDLERPKKFVRANLTGFKRQKVSHEIAPLRNESHESSSHASMPASVPAANPEPLSGDKDVRAKTWNRILQSAQSFAPRVGNHRCPADSEAWQLAQDLLKDVCQISDMFVCRGTERFQVPLSAPKSSESPLRYTVCLKREDSTVHDCGLEDWHQTNRAQRIRKCVPSKLTVTIFGQKPASELAPAALPISGFDSNQNSTMTEPPSAVRVHRSSDLPIAVHQRTSNTVCEGWAPPPVALHGPHFRCLKDHEKQDLVKLHKNLGHPDPNVLAQHLRANGAASHIIDAAKEYICDACVESTRFSHQRPSKLHEPREFNEAVGIDGFYWTGKAGFQVLVFHCIDEASLFQLGRRLEHRHLEHVIPAFTEMWFSWAGQPQSVYSDPAGEFRSHEWSSFLQSMNIEPRFSTEAWQKGRVERHGQILKNMLSRYDQEKQIMDLQEFDLVLQACCQAKNALARQHGYSPEQIVLGKSTKLAASLSSDDQVGAHSLADGTDLDSERFRKHLEIRSRARKLFMLADNDASIRRALLRRTCPVRGPFEVGQTVMYWLRRNVPGRREGGRWHGPAKVVCQDGSSTIWVAHGDRLMRCSPESLRPSSLREWNSTQQRLDNQIEEVQQQAQQNIMPLTDEPLQDETYSPSIPPEPHDGAPEMHHNLSNQPESELFPDNLTTNQNTPVHEPSNPPTNPTENHESIDPEPIDLDTELSDDSALYANVSEEIFACQAIDQQNPECDLLDWSVFQPGTETSQVCLAEDDLPLLEHPLEIQEHQCFMLEVPMTRQDLIRWSESSQPEELAQVASASKRARSEVQIKDLTSKERKLFDEAKQAELTCWLQTNALRPILRRQLNPDQILKSRWVLTWKSVPVEDNPEGRKAKARLVVLGFQDPRLTEVARDAPTLTKEGRHAILQAIASYQWTLTSFDIKTAFLRGKADSDNPLAMEPPRELQERMQLTNDQVCSLIGNAYGRVDAPLLFYKELSKQLKDLDFKMHPLEPCIHYLESWKNGKRILHGILGTHVDDGVGGGDLIFHEKLNLLRKNLPFGSFKQRKFTFTGIQLEQLPDFSIRASQKDYVNAIPHIEIGKHRRSQPESAVNDQELSCLRGLIGSLQYATTHTRPDVASKLGEIQIQLSKPTVQTLLSANKVLREAQSTSDVQICFRSISPKKLTHVVFGDASFASPKQLASFQGTIVFATTPDLHENKKAPVSPLTWSSKKISRVVRSTLSAEAFSMSRSVDKMGWCRLLWGTFAIEGFNWREPAKAFAQMHAAVIVTDCKSLFDLVSRRAMPTCEEYRTTLEVLLIKERCQEHCHFRWIPTVLQLADPLTKNMDASLLRAVLEQGSFQLFDEQSSLETNAHRKQALTWIQEPI